MTVDRDLPAYQAGRRLYDRYFQALPGAMEQVERWVDLLANARYQHWATTMLDVLRQEAAGGPDGFNPLARDQEYITAVNADDHPRCAGLGLRSKNWLLMASLWPGNSIDQHNFLALDQTLYHLLLLERHKVWDLDELDRFYGLFDRLLFGGRRFAAVTRTPRVTNAYYVGLRRTTLSGFIRQTRTGRYLFGLIDVQSPLGRAWQGKEWWNKMAAMQLEALDVLTTANAYREGRTRCDYADAHEAVDTYIALFEHGDLFGLPRPEREAEPYRGFGKDPRYAVPD